MKQLSLKASPVTERAGMNSIAVALVALFIPAICAAAPTARVSASRTSGPAPLAVFFDATGTTDSNSAVSTFREIGYRFTFGDASGTWAYSGKPKDQQIGAPLAAHVFEKPGTYTVQVTAKDAAGASSTASTVITVESPDSYFSSTKTVCLSTSSDFAGCPAGAQQIANASSYPAFQSGTRYLLHRGQDFTGLGEISYGSGQNGLSDSQLGAFGSGAKPLVGGITVISGSGASTWHKRVVVMDLDSGNIKQDTGGYDLLVFRNTLNRGGSIVIADTYVYYSGTTAGGLPAPQNIFVVENDIDKNYTGNVNAITGNAMRFAIMGNSGDRTVEHNLRVWQANKAFIAHNKFTGRSKDTIRHAIKVHAEGTDAITDLVQDDGKQGTGQRTSQVAIADNVLGSSTSNINWLVSVTPQNDLYPEGLEYVVVEDNKFEHGTNFNLDIAWAGREMVDRGNVSVNTGKSALVGIGHVDALASLWNGPYFTGQASMKLRFSSDDKRPVPPSVLSIQ